MLYKFLNKWVEENKTLNLVFRSISKFEDQYFIEFNKQKKRLQISLSSQECFCFFTKNNILPTKQRNELNNFNTHLLKAKLEEISIVEDDRIIILNFNKIDIYNKKLEYQLIIELIPRYQNIILAKLEDNRSIIIDCLRKVSFAENTQRQILPGLVYTRPQTEFKIDSPKVNFPLKIESVKKITESSNDQPNFTSIDKLFEELYYNWIFKARNDRIRNSRIKRIKSEIKKKKKKINKQQIELDTASKEESWKQQAELLKANFSLLKKGMSSIVLQNYYEDDFPDIEIKLNPEKDAKQNIEYYFKKYRKARDGKEIIKKQINITNNEIEHLEREIFDLEETEIFLENKVQHNKAKKHKKGYKKITVDKDWEIFIGRTSKENDELTTKFAQPHDWWFHTRVFRGTHVILRNYNKRELPNKLRLLCSQLAAYYSKAKSSSNVPVDVTQIRYVTKPRGSAPGFVVYKNQNTLFVDPLSMREVVQIIKGQKEKL